MKNKASIDDVNAMIVDEMYDVLKDGRTTVCTLVLDNGFTVRGESSCVAIENFDAALGQKYARERAVANVWQFAGFRVAEELAKRREVEQFAGDWNERVLADAPGEYNEWEKRVWRRGWFAGANIEQPVNHGDETKRVE